MLAAGGRCSTRQRMGNRNRQRHQLGRFFRREAEHHALVAGAAGVDAHRDVGRLSLNRDKHAAGVAVETEVGVGVAGVGYGSSRIMLADLPPNS